MSEFKKDVRDGLRLLVRLAKAEEGFLLQSSVPLEALVQVVGWSIIRVSGGKILRKEPVIHDDGSAAAAVYLWLLSQGPHTVDLLVQWLKCEERHVQGGLGYLLSVEAVTEVNPGWFVANDLGDEFENNVRAVKEADNG